MSFQDGLYIIPRHWLQLLFFNLTYTWRGKAEVKMLVAQLCPTLCNPWTVTHQTPMSMEFSRQEYWRILYSLLQEIFLTQGLNSCLLHCRQILYCLSHMWCFSLSVVILLLWDYKMHSFSFFWADRKPKKGNFYL